MRKVKDAVDLTTNEKIYFKGHAKATYLSDGRNVEDALVDSDVFKAEYGVTAYEEVIEAYNKGKVIRCDYQNACYVMSSISTTHIFFSIINANNSSRIYVRANSTWGQEFTVLEQTTNKTKTISESSTDAQYPSAKAVYDALQNVGGGSDVFEAIKGETSYDEIKAAFEANKVVYCYWETRIYMLTKLEAGAAYFAVTHGNYYYRLVCYPGAASTSWGTTSENFQHSLKTLENGNAQITIAGKTAEVATPQYVETLLGTIINGDY